MSNHVAWRDIRAELVERAGGEAMLDAAEREFLAEVTGQRLAEIRRSPDLVDDVGRPVER